MKIYAPVKNTNGVYASVRFINGVGETDNPKLIEWFKAHGYRLEKCDAMPQNPPEKCEVNLVIDTPNEQIELQNEEVDFDSMTPNELRQWAIEHGLGTKIRNTRNKEKLLEIIRG